MVFFCASSEPWIPRPTSFTPIQIGRSRENRRLVADYLVDGEWNEELLREDFIPGDVEIIKAIPVSHEGGEDYWEWNFDDRERYSVKSGYLVGMNTTMETTSGPTRREMVD